MMTSLRAVPGAEALACRRRFIWRALERLALNGKIFENPVQGF